MKKMADAPYLDIFRLLYDEDINAVFCKRCTTVFMQLILRINFGIAP